VSDAGGEGAGRPRPNLGAIFSTFLVIGAVSFGGGMVAYLRDMLVGRRRWVNDDEFLAALEIGQTLPGLNSTNVSILVGDQLRGIRGAVVAFLGVMLPGTLVLLVVGLLYGMHGARPGVARVLDGAGAAAVALLGVVTVQLGRKQLSGVTDLLLVLATVVAVSRFHLPLVVVLAVLGPLAVWLYRPAREAA
jgi:chromate transporter